MTETKKTFKRNNPLTDLEVKAILKTEFGPQLRAQDLPVDRPLIVRLDAPVKKSQYEWPVGKNPPTYKESFKVQCTYFPQGKPDGFSLSVQIGENAVTLLDKKFPNNSYVGMMAFISKPKLHQQIG